MEDITPQDMRGNNKNDKDDKILYNHYRTNCGLCCVCHTPPVHSRSYYGHVFCTDCFYKYIFTPTKAECSGDLVKKETKEKETKEKDSKEKVSKEKETKEVADEAPK